MTTGKSRSGLPGEAVPNEGECEITQTSSGTDVLTLTLNSSVTDSGGGRALVIGRNAGDGTLSSAEIFAVHYDGIQERRHVVAISTASSAITMAASQSGALCVIGDNTGTETVVTLPPVKAGLWYEFYQAGGVKASGTTIKSATAGLLVVYNDSAADTVSIGGTTSLCVGGSLRVVSDGTQWHVITQPGLGSEAPSTAVTTMFHKT